MTIFTDHCIHKDIVLTLREKGKTVITAEEVKLAAASDNTIFDYIIANNLILLTFDQDFGNVLRFNIHKTKGVIIVYIENMSKLEINQKIIHFLEKFPINYLKGKLFIIEKDKIRIWPR